MPVSLKLSAALAIAASTLLLSDVNAGQKCRGGVQPEVVALNDKPKTESKPADRKDLVDTAVEAGSFKTLAAALKAAGLVDALKGKGPFTVFAPTDEAFKKLPAGTVESLLKPENKEKLTAILKYHVVSGNVKAADVVKLEEAKTLQGQMVKVDTKDGVKINASKVVKTDILCSNGVIHVIDTVLLPE